MMAIVCLAACSTPSSHTIVTSVSHPDVSTQNAYYTGNREPLLPLHFLYMNPDKNSKGSAHFLQEQLVRYKLDFHIPRILEGLGCLAHINYKKLRLYN